jgi:hypothetical protein
VVALIALSFSFSISAEIQAAAVVALVVDRTKAG